MGWILVHLYDFFFSPLPALCHPGSLASISSSRKAGRVESWSREEGGRTELGRKEAGRAEREKKTVYIICCCCYCWRHNPLPSCQALSVPSSSIPVCVPRTQLGVNDRKWWQCDLATLMYLRTYVRMPLNLPSLYLENLLLLFCCHGGKAGEWVKW